LAKHDENYMPPEVADALEKSNTAKGMAKIESMKITESTMITERTKIIESIKDVETAKKIDGEMQNESTKAQ